MYCSAIFLFINQFVLDFVQMKVFYIRLLLLFLGFIFAKLHATDDGDKANGSALSRELSDDPPSFVALEPP